MCIPLTVIDFSNENLKPGTDKWVSVCQVVRTAFEEHGGFLALYDKINTKLYESVFSAMKQLFDLPLETKKQKTSDRPFHGYIGQVLWLPLYESMAIEGPLTMIECQKFAQIMCPQGNHGFCDIMNEYSKLLGELDHIAKKMVFESYGVDMKICDSMIESSNYILRCLKYRPREIDENDIGLQPHSDLTIISVVLQNLTLYYSDFQYKHKKNNNN
ncbi:probable 2-oxoglutarate-dependent dioxygenase AOP1.2 [Trifolium pratense]|uniref:probable 2-oxoglutarate-dependent dioxygenase AOP1.2 n=1 Tax=Trifolium pratense TaxID=57577 RepID=UPI001E697C92|nr:probable 2-oxoglutarate-dependent dioxygenase AOP1.2 [Trifolium pratense]